MSRENLELVRRTYAAYGTPELRAVAEADWHPDIEWQASEAFGTLRGRPAVLAYFADWLDSFEDVRLRLEETIDAGDHVVAVHRLGGRGKASGISLDAHLAVVFNLHTGRIARACEYATRDDALEAAGLKGRT